MPGPISDNIIKPDGADNIPFFFPATPPIIFNPGLSTISPSDLTALTTVTEASYPKLYPPEMIGAMFIQAKNDAITSMLDGWLKNLEEIKAMIKEELTSPKYLAILERQSSAYLAKLADKLSLADPPPKAIAEALAKNPNSSAHQMYMDDLQRSLNTATGLSTALNHYMIRIDEGNQTAIQSLSHFVPLFVTGAGAPLAGFVVAGMGEAKEVASHGVFQVMWQNTALIIPSDARFELGWIASLLGAGLITQSMTDGVVNFKPGAKPNQLDIAEARTFAKNAIQLVQNPEINLFIQTMVIQQTENGQPVSEDRAMQLTNMVKAALLSTALALVYRTETGGITAEEFEGMLNGEMVLDKGDIKGSLSGLINEYLGALSSAERSLFKDAVFNYLASKPPIDQLLQPARAFQGILSSLNNLAPVEG